MKMAGIYPSLEDKFKNEGICPICMMTISSLTKYSCVNDHTICHRCRPYYFTCPTCNSPMDVEISQTVAEGYHSEPVTPYLPHPYPPYPPSAAGVRPSAPFIDEEKRDAWRRPAAASEDEELKRCSFDNEAGCEARFPERLREMHEARCELRPNVIEVNKAALIYDEEEEEKDDDAGTSLTECRFRDVGCSVRMAHWRKAMHERACNYRGDMMNKSCVNPVSADNLTLEDDPDEIIVECRFRRQGCMVRMPRRRKNIHEDKCNHAATYYYGSSSSAAWCSDQSSSASAPDAGAGDSSSSSSFDENVNCPWAEHGCKVMPKLDRIYEHARKCNYRMERCSYQGCQASFHPSARYAHERKCEYA